MRVWLFFFSLINYYYFFCIIQLQASMLAAALIVSDCSQCLDTSLSVPVQEEIIVSCHFLPAKGAGVQSEERRCSCNVLWNRLYFWSDDSSSICIHEGVGQLWHFSFIAHTELLRGSFPLPSMCVLRRLGFQTRVSKIKRCYLLGTNAWRSALQTRCKQGHPLFEGWTVS